MSTSQDSNVRTNESPYKISERLFKLCQSSDSVSSLLARDPSLAPGEAWKKLFGHHECCGNGRDIHDIGKVPVSPEELRRARACGKWGPQEPSELFLRIYHDALCTLDDDLAGGMVSPCLMGSSGTMPLTIVSVIPDIVRHMSNLIVRAQKEVFLATNYWQNGVASKYITDAIRELSRRAGERGGARIVMKILYDRGSPRQLLNPHYLVPESEYTGESIGLPPRSEIPNVDLQVMNYHRLLLGTFHAKYMVVDRRVAVVQSNNIQDNDNVEMMVEVEGPIVDSIYDMALLSWHERLEPPLPTRESPAAENGTREASSSSMSHDDIFSSEGTIKGYSVIVDPDKMPKENYDLEAIHQTRAARRGRTASSDETNTTPATESPTNDAIGPRRFQPQDSHGHSSKPSEELFKAATTTALPEHTTDDPHYDDTLAGEIQRVQASLLPQPGETPTQALSRHLNHTMNRGFQGTAPSRDPPDAVTPYVPHAARTADDAFAMALLCRPPHGAPARGPLANPQDAAWLSALRGARHSVFIQSPTLNAEALLPAIAQACERGVHVYCYVCLGYNDAGELLPLQGGHNESVSHHLHTSSLLSSSAKQRLHWHWYVAADQTFPLPSSSSPSSPRRRSCHIKLLIVDSRVGIVGSGNQDTQSWTHSQEANLLVDSARVCRAWLDAVVRRGQNTALYGAVDRVDGVWRDRAGREAPGATGVEAGRLRSLIRGVVGAVRRVRGEGGF
ncbi:hypothetical protein AAE478_000490 [Parahypoxylon ruwenzoriense]